MPGIFFLSKEKNQRFLLNFGAMSPNLLSGFSFKSLNLKQKVPITWKSLRVKIFQDHFLPK
jgi:hypothetical protein